MAEEYIQVLMTAGSDEEAARLAQTLVEARLAACVQTVGPITSRYWWEGEVQTEQEWLCVAKTTAARYEALSERVRADHSYEIPEITAIPVVGGLAEYLGWIRREVDASA